jgi:hypothetical protein
MYKLRLDDRGLRFDSWRGLGIFLFTTASRTALRPTHPPIQWVPGALSLEVKRPGRETDHSPSSSDDVKNQSPSTPSWRGASVSTGQLYFYVTLAAHLFLTTSSLALHV